MLTLLFTQDPGSHWIWKKQCSLPFNNSLLFNSDISEQFIDVATNSKEKRAGFGLQSYTQDVQAIRIKNHRIYKDRIVLLDTPGFDDTTRSDMDILALIGDWLKKM